MEEKGYAYRVFRWGHLKDIGVVGMILLKWILKK
jgi:hypothetical protein